MTRMQLGAQRRSTGGRKGQAGFSLTEVAVALSVAGLMVGGVLKSVELMEQGRMLKSGTLLEQTATGHQLFMDKYQYMPGDLPGAAELIAEGAVNGNGDNILSVTGDTQASDGYTGEAYQYWSHLAAAGMGPGSNGYIKADVSTGLTSATSTESIIEGTHFPTFPSGGFMQVISGKSARLNKDTSVRGSTSALGDTASEFPQIRLNELYYRVGRHVTTATQPLSTSAALNNAPAITAVDVARMDLKFDDGRPSSGRMMTTTTSCLSSGTTLADQNYNYNNTTAAGSSACVLLYRAANSGGSTALVPTVTP